MEFKPENIKAPEKGKLLVSDPMMGDPYFQRAVILICEHNEEGSFGFILNKYVEIDLDDLVEDIPAIANRVSIGGPVENNHLYYLHRLGEELPGSVEVSKGLYVGGDFDILKNMLSQKRLDKDQIRFFVGYSGWGEGQLLEEMDSESWYVSEINELPIMDTERDDLWELAFKKMGGSFAILANFPNDPGMN